MGMAVFRNILITSVFLYWMFSTNVEPLKTYSCLEMSREQARLIVKTKETHIGREIKDHINEILKNSVPPVSMMKLMEFRINYAEHVEQILHGNDLTRYYNCTERSLYDKYYELLKLDFPHIKRACADKISCAVVYHYNLMQYIENHRFENTSLVDQDNTDSQDNDLTSLVLDWTSLLIPAKENIIKEDCSELTIAEINRFNKLHSRFYSSFDQFLKSLYYSTYEFSYRNLDIVRKHFDIFLDDFFKDFKNILLRKVTKTYTCTTHPFVGDVFKYLKEDFPNIEKGCANKIHCALMHYYNIAERNIDIERRARPNHRMYVSE